MHVKCFMIMKIFKKNKKAVPIQSQESGYPILNLLSQPQPADAHTKLPKFWF